jgi:anhydro-N-acetylmuramic acid kinase
LGEWYASSFRKLISAIPSDLTPDIIANHGQTVSHFPDIGMTWQLGDPTRISRDTGLTVISQFRDGDMAVGGQGAPLAPLFHQMIAEGLRAHSREGIAIHNLGGISNLTYIGPRILAFDTGPASVWIDAAIEKITHGRQKFDREGRIALSAQPDESSLKKLMKHPYFPLRPPKSTGRDEFSIDAFFAKARARGPSLVATATQVTIDSIVNAYRRWILNEGLPLQTIYFCGGGAKNHAILQGIQRGLPGVSIRRLDETGLDSKMIEAQAFAVFGFLTLLGQPLGGEWTGARDFGPPAHIVPGRNWHSVIESLSQY